MKKNFAVTYSWVHNVLRSVVPLCIMCVLGCCTVYALRRSSRQLAVSRGCRHHLDRRRSTMTPRNRRTIQATLHHRTLNLKFLCLAPRLNTSLIQHQNGCWKSSIWRHAIVAWRWCWWLWLDSLLSASRRTPSCPRSSVSATTTKHTWCVACAKLPTSWPHQSKWLPGMAHVCILSSRTQNCTHSLTRSVGRSVITDFLLTVNSACNFILYCAFNTVFRNRFRALITSGCRARRSRQSAEVMSRRRRTGASGRPPKIQDFCTNRKRIHDFS